MAKHCAIKYLMVLSKKNDIWLYLLTCLSLFWRNIMWFLRPLGLIMFCQPVIIAVITQSVHHTIVLRRWASIETAWENCSVFAGLTESDHKSQKIEGA